MRIYLDECMLACLCEQMYVDTDAYMSVFTNACLWVCLCLNAFVLVVHLSIHPLAGTRHHHTRRSKVLDQWVSCTPKLQPGWVSDGVSSEWVKEESGSGLNYSEAEVPLEVLWYPRARRLKVPSWLTNFAVLCVCVCWEYLFIGFRLGVKDFPVLYLRIYMRVQWVQFSFIVFTLFNMFIMEQTS